MSVFMPLPRKIRYYFVLDSPMVALKVLLDEEFRKAQPK